jgi:hypothetical protein
MLAMGFGGRSLIASAARHHLVLDGVVIVTTRARIASASLRK